MDSKALQLSEMFSEEVMKAISQNEPVLQAFTTLVEKIQIINEELNFTKESVKQLYMSKSLEEATKSMSELSATSLGVDKENVKVYCFDSREGTIFCADENNDREFITFEKNSITFRALMDEEVYINNNAEGIIIFNSNEQYDNPVNNVMVVPLKSSNGTSLGVVVATNKEGGFAEKDANRFIQDGNIINTFSTCLESKLSYEFAMTDELTRLGNRHGLNSFVKNNLYNNRNDATSIIMADIDHFKKFNDNYGHDIGDKCLRKVAQTIKDSLRKDERNNAFRFGGEEMLVVVRANEKDAYDIAERIRENISNISIPTDKGNINVTASFGVTQIDAMELSTVSRDEINDQFLSWLKNADQNLYQAKKSGRNCVYASEKTNSIKNIEFDSPVEPLRKTHNEIEL